MRRILGIVPLSLMVACGGVYRAPASAPTPDNSPLEAGRPELVPRPPVAHATRADSAAARAADSVMLPPPPVMDSSLLAAEFAAELQIAADSAADEVALDQLASAAPPAEADDPADAASDETADGTTGDRALTNATWDIDVETYTRHDRVKYYLRLYQGPARERMEVWLNRMPRYEAMIRQRLQEENLPGDLVYLALIESGFSNTATSRSRAVGMWQFMKATAKMSGLRVDSWVDERRDPYRATEAAAHHLKYLNDRFGSIYLAAAAYNAGSGKVSRSLNRLPDDDDADAPNTDADFFRLYDTRFLHRETRDYVPKLIAAALIAKEPTRYGFAVNDSATAAYDSLIVPGMTGLDVLARLADTTVAAVRELNPQYLRLATPPGVAALVRLPSGRGQQTAAAYASLPPSRRVTFVEHLVRRGETLSGIGKRYGISAQLIVSSNPRLLGRQRGRLRAGQRVIIPTGGALSTRVARRMADPVAPAGTGTSGWHRVRRGETLSGIADEYGVRERELRSWNKLGRGNRILVGQRLRVQSAERARTTRSSRVRRAG
ncbi:MAG: transglycosylase SLT domain-containing protein [Gemmatimonadales bacterium]|nr:transglycosylase SLT domain-containing protein [Gemmatimonadales bacterium]